MNIIYKKWNYETIKSEALKYNSRSEFAKNSNGAYSAAIRLNILDEVCAHIKPKLKYWSLESLKEEALKYKTKTEFQKKSGSAYNSALNLNILNQICSHMEIIYNNWEFVNLQQKALKYNHKKDFQKKDANAYMAACRMGILNQICSHMKPLWKEKWNHETIKLEALKYKTRTEFIKNNGSAYQAAKRLNILDEICSHMQKSRNISIPEQYLFDKIKEYYPKTQRFTDCKVNIPDKSYIKRLEIDIYVPELRKGIEFDGKYHHSFEGLKRSRPDWPEEDIVNYHQIKDKYFLSKNIQILHIQEQDWLKDQELCIKNCLEFLNNKEIK